MKKLKKFQQRSNVMPKTPAAASQLGMKAKQALACFQKGDRQGAKALYQRILQKHPRHVDALLMSGVIEYQSGNYESAREFLTQGLKVQPSHVGLNSNLGLTLMALKKPEQALGYFDNAINFAPDRALLHANRALALQYLERYQESEAAVLVVRKLSPDYPGIEFQHGNLLFLMNRFDEALVLINGAIVADPDNANAYFMRAKIALRQARDADALVDLDRAVELDDKNPDFLATRARSNLRNLQFAKGWDEFLWRFHAQSEADQYKMVRRDLPYWRPGMSRERVLFWGEQGYGENILFGTMLGEAQKSFGDIYLKIDPRLVPLFQRSFEGVTYVTPDSGYTESDFDSHMALADLGRFLRRDITAFKKQPSAYLRPDKLRSAALREKLVHPGTRLIGVAWRSFKRDNGALIDGKSIDLDTLEPILSLDNVTFVNLQYGDVQADLSAYQAATGREIRNDHGVDLFDDFDGLAALMDACDAIVGSSSGTVHLAGAIGKKTWVLLPRGFKRLWFWHLDDGPCLWYPSLQLVSQPEPGNWQSPVITVKDAIVEEML